MDASKDRASNTRKRSNTIDNGLNTSPSSAINTDDQNSAKGQKETKMGSGKDNGSNASCNASGASGGTGRKRCDKCGKKLGLTSAFSCRCGGNFCAVHRYSFQHGCNVDYRALGAEQIRRDNPVVSAEKIRKL